MKTLTWQRTGRLAATALLTGLATAPLAAAEVQKLSNLEGDLPFPLPISTNFGRSMTALGDYDGDGVEDLAVGTSLHASPGGDVTGGVYLLFLDTDGTVKSHRVIDDGPDGLDGALDVGTGFGDAVALIGDIDGNGVRDLIVGAPRDDDGQQDSGAVWVLRMDTDLTVLAATKISDTTGNTSFLPLPLGEFFQNFGASVAGGGDLDGDGLDDDVIVGLPGDFQGRGAAIVMSLDDQGRTDGHVTLKEGAGGFLHALDPGDAFGTAVALVDDHDGNGVDDVLVSAVGDDQQGQNMGAVYRLSLNPGGVVGGSWKMVENSPPYTVPATMSRWGASLATGADLNQDGSEDILVGERFKDGDHVDQGGLWLVFANLDQQPLRWDEIGEAGETLDLDFDLNAQLGASVVLIGDLNDDGQQDWAVGAPEDDDLHFGSGAVFIVMPDPGSYDWTTSHKDLGQALAGDSTPRMFIPGAIVHPYWTNIEVRHTQPGSLAHLVVGASELSAPLKGGVLVPHPDVIFQPLVTNAWGHAAHSLQWPTTFPSGFQFYSQYWVEDASGPDGWIASNALVSTEP